MSDLNAIVETHGDAVWRTAYRLLNRHDEALDCYQETFLAALRLSRRQQVRNWRAMLVRIATRRALDQLRRRYQGETAVDYFAQRAQRRSEQPEARARLEELVEQVRRALANLPDQQAEAFWLRHLEQLTPDEVAEQMEIEPGHARVLVHRATVALREILGPAHGPEHVSEESP